MPNRGMIFCRSSVKESWRTLCGRLSKVAGNKQSRQIFSGKEMTTMFCMRCGQDVPAAAEFCPACGQATKLPDPQAAQPPNYGAVPPPPSPQHAGYLSPGYGAAPSNLKGVGGFLLVYCIFLTIVWPVWTLSQYALRPAMLRTGMLRAISAITLLRMAYGIAVGISLWAASRSALVLLRIYFVIATI